MIISGTLSPFACSFSTASGYLFCGSPPELSRIAFGEPHAGSGGTCVGITFCTAARDRDASNLCAASGAASYSDVSSEKSSAATTPCPPARRSAIRFPPRKSAISPMMLPGPKVPSRCPPFSFACACTSPERSTPTHVASSPSCAMRSPSSNSAILRKGKRASSSASVKPVNADEKAWSEEGKD